MTPRQRLKFTKLGIIVLVWIIIGFLIACYDYTVLRSDLSSGSSAHFSFGSHVVLSMLTGLLGALMGGSFLIFYVNEKYRDKPYGLTIAAVVLSFIMVVSLVAVILALIAAPLETGKGFSSRETMTSFKNYLFDPLHLKNIIVWSGVVAMTQVMLQFNTKFGEGNLWNMIRGKYQTPKIENRIFMFVDLNGSTTIAEKLGDEHYHALLKTYFADITNPILDNRGQIYQYVGDEVIISWSYEEGIADCRCIECFFAMRKQIQQHADDYIKEYGLIPEFKAGLHFGNVVAGEVGVIKRDITFSGDVLNTTSRIQGKCKEFNAAIIASGELLNTMNTGSRYTIRFLGSIQLRGKEKNIELAAIEPVNT